MTRSIKKLFHKLIVIVVLLIFVLLIWNQSNPEIDTKWKLNGFKTILAYELPSWFQIHDGSEVFSDLKCPVQKCRLTTNRYERHIADLVLFHEHYVESYHARPKNQIYAVFNMESPVHTVRIPYPDIINWTITYRYDSTIPSPYRVWTYYDKNVTQIKQNRNYASNKTKKIAWFVSNCNDKNGRLKYARELQQYIQVDIYGRCGSLFCSLDTREKCYQMLADDYKFYLAFENSNCEQYITEKLFENALQYRVLPIVMGARPEFYKNHAPEHSYIHVDEFKSPKELANFLHQLDKNDELYNQYFAWIGTGRIAKEPLKHFCKLCEMLHDNTTMTTSTFYKDINQWWHAPGICTTDSWRNFDAKHNHR